LWSRVCFFKKNRFHIKLSTNLGNVHIIRNTIFRIFRPPPKQKTVQIPILWQGFVTNC
jgi:hypothetical protein